MLRVLGTAALLCGAASISFSAGLPARPVHGNYIEARTSDVYTGPCFANGEVDMAGKEAVFGWKINDGTWHGVNLEGLSVVGVVRTEHTLGDAYQPVNRALAVLIVDDKANTEQRTALQSFAKYMAGDLLKNVVAVDSAPIELAIENGNIHGGTASLTAGSLAAIRTRALAGTDHLCGNEETFYPPLTDKLEHAMPAYALENSYQGNGLGEKWDSRLRRSSFIGTFQVSAN
jgi:hypothetical protein